MKNQINLIINRLTLLGIIGLLSSCGGGSGGSGGSTVANAVAVAGTSLDIARNNAASLDGSGSSDPDGDSLTYKWTQTGGPDVTGGAGFLTGMMPPFNAPLDVSTLSFDLSVNDGNGDSMPDSVKIYVLEHTGPSFYVDGDNGSDSTGDGSRINPFATISNAVNSIPAPNHDIYVKTLAAGQYDETNTTLNIPNDTSLYGGYGDNWVRDVSNNRTGLSGHVQAVHFTQVNNDAWFSGFDLTAGENGVNPPFSSSAVSADSGTATLYIQDNSIASGNITAPVSSPIDIYGLRLAGVSAVSVLRNTITAGSGGDSPNLGNNGITGPNGRNGISTGSHLAGPGGCANPGQDGCPSVHNSGGLAGEGGARGGVNGAPGHRGWNALDTTTATGGIGGAGGYGGSSTNSGGHGGGGGGGTGGRGGDGGTGNGAVLAGFYLKSTAVNGTNGRHGVGGGGGGGGEGGSILGGYGGGGGGGGQGGIAGTGGAAGGSGGASIGILLADITDAVIDSNTITSSNGGAGAAGGIGGNGGSGGWGGGGRGLLDGGEAGGNGGGGGMGGEGGQGGAGAGGPSYTIMVGINIAPVISNNTLIAGTGGAPGADGAGSGGGAYGGCFGEAGQSGSTRKGGSIPRTTCASSGTTAQGGWAYNIFDVNPVDGLVPALNNNSFTSGMAGLRGDSGASNF